MKKIIYLLIAMTPALINSCGSGTPDKTGSNDNPLLAKWETPHETPPFDKIKTEHYLPAFEEALKQARADIDAIANNTSEATFENTLDAMEHAGGTLEKVASVFFNLNSAETNDAMEEIASAVTPMLTEYGNDVNLNPKLFARVKHVYENQASANLNAEQKRLLDESYTGFVRRGANLSDSDKEKYREFSAELSMASLKFGQNVLAETNAYTLHITDKNDLAGLPDGVIDAAASEAKTREKEGWIFTLQLPSYGEFVKYADNRKLREEIYRAQSSKCSKGNEFDNKEIIRTLTNLRLQRAQLFGAKSYADYSLLEQMAENPQRVNDLLNQLITASKIPATNDVAEVQALAKSMGADFKIMPWDFSYYSEKLKTKKYDLNDEVTRPYFKLDNVIKGVFDLSTRLYGLTYVENSKMPVYHADVKAYEVSDENGKFLAVLYLDFFPRAGKRGGAWMTSYREQYQANGTDHRPFVSLVCNFTKPTADKPALLSFSEVETFLHEFGHGLHGMLSDVQYRSLSGTSVSRDFVELPSQIMENWAVEKDFLDMFAEHYETGEKIPADLVKRIINSSNYLAGYLSMRQLTFGTLDMAFHSIDKPFEGDISEFEKKATANVQVLPVVEGTMTSSSFSHIFAGGYSAGYYSYKWSEVLDADAFAVFQQNGIFDKATAKSFRDNVLSKGNTDKAMNLYVNFRGQEPSINALLKRSGFIK